jgi:histone H2A
MTSAFVDTDSLYPSAYAVQDFLDLVSADSSLEASHALHKVASDAKLHSELMQAPGIIGIRTLLSKTTLWQVQCLTYEALCKLYCSSTMSDIRTSIPHAELVQGLRCPSEQVQHAAVKVVVREAYLSRDQSLHDEMTAYLHTSHCIPALELILKNSTLDLQDVPRSQALIKALCRILAAFSDYPLITRSLSLLEMFLSTKAPQWLQAAIEGNVFGIIFNLSGYPDDSIKISALNLLRGFSHIAELQREVQSRGLLMLIRLLSNPIDGLRTAAAEILNEGARGSLDTRNSLILWNFAPALTEVLSGQYADVKDSMLEVLLMLLRDNQQANLDELIENNIITVLCRMTERDLQHRGNALQCIQVLVELRNPLYSAILNSCRVDRLLDNVRGQGGQHGATASEVLRLNFPKFSHLAPVAPIVLAPPTATPPPTIVAPQPPTVPSPAIRPSLTATQRTRKQRAPRSKGKVSTKPTRNTVSTKAGLLLPISRIDRELRKTKYRVSRSASVYCTAVLEYLTAEVLHMASIITRSASRLRITPRDLLDAIRGDDELSVLVKATVLPESGGPELGV